MKTERLVTGSEAGLSGEEQIRIALRTIVENGGIAQIQQIYRAVESVLKGNGFRLSKQGEHSLRFFVNKVAVEAGYIYPHDKRRRGWRITPMGREYIEAMSTDPDKSAGMITQAGDNFQFSLSDVYALLAVDLGKTDALSQVGQQNRDVFVRAGVILTVTAWETFIEDTLALHFQKRLREASTPGDIQSTFNRIAQAWIDQVRGRPKPPDMAQWAGDGWKNILLDKFSVEISRFNTPNSENIKDLFERYLDLNVEPSWRWRGMSSTTACQKLDELIKLRGELVHRARISSTTGPLVRREHLMEMIALVEQLAWGTEVTFGLALKEAKS